MKEFESEIAKQTKDNKTEIRVQAVFEMLKGEKVKVVSKKFKVGSGTLYKLRRRAWVVIRREIEFPVEEKHPAYNRLPAYNEDKVSGIV